MKSIAATKQGGYFEYKPMYVSKLPIKIIDSGNKIEIEKKNEIIKHVDQIMALIIEKNKSENLKPDFIQNRIDYAEQRINEIVYELYGLSKEEVELIEKLF